MYSRRILNSNLAKIYAASRNNYPQTATTTPSGTGNEIVTRQYHETVGDVIVPSQVMGIDHLRDPRLNKGLGFSLEERQILGIHGLQPARFKSQEEQLELCKISLNRYAVDLNKYLYLTDLHDRNERLFYRLLSENIEDLMPIVYTPTVGLACQKFGLIYRRPRGLFITINDKGHVYDVLRNWPEPDVRAICVTDGERILGLGDLGACGMGIPVGKLALYTALAGIMPHQCLPIQIDVGTNNKMQLEDPLYVGLRQPRVKGAEYYALMDEFMEAVARRYEQNTLVQFEDFGNENAFYLLDKYKNTYCTFNDDIQGTAAVVVGGLYAAKRITGKSISQNKVLCVGAGEAAIGIADLLVEAMVVDGLSQEEARNNIWMCDIHGLLTTTRKEGDLCGHKAFYAKNVEAEKDLLKICQNLKPSILIGASAASGLFSSKILSCMVENNERPIVFALSNPTVKAECTAQDAYDHTKGRVIFSSGSPFPPVKYEGRTYFPGQGNNAYIFPGVALGVIATGTHHIPNDMFLIAAQELSKSVEQSDLDKGSLYPQLNKIKDVSMKIAVGVTECAYSKGLAAHYPEPTDKRAWLKKQLFDHNYASSMPVTWPWPKAKPYKTRPLEPTLFFKDTK